MKNAEKELLHCMRCHQEFKKGSKQKCVIEHATYHQDPDNTADCHKVSRSIYEGPLRCCGALHRFRNDGDEGRSKPKFCFKGLHTDKASEVRYNGTSMTVCCAIECGVALAYSAKQAQAEQETKRMKRKKNRKEKQTQMYIKRIESKPKGLQRREARKVRAEMLRLDHLDPDELNSSFSDNSCSEFDYASDGSLIMEIFEYPDAKSLFEKYANPENCPHTANQANDLSNEMRQCKRMKKAINASKEAGTNKTIHPSNEIIQCSRMKKDIEAYEKAYLKIKDTKLAEQEKQSYAAKLAEYMKIW